MGKLKDWMLWWRHARYGIITTLRSEHGPFFDPVVISLISAGFVSLQNRVLATLLWRE